LDLIANYSWTDTEITEGENAGNRLANAPEHAASPWLDYTLKDGAFAGLGFGAGVRYVGARYAENANTTHLDANTLFDAALHYEKQNYKLSLNVRNLTDEAYVSTCGSFGCYWGDGRTVTAKLSYKW
ncbi:TonB-dependent receptor, partial [Mycobacterium tuberculosis]|nr:TonB-dependent receptor [Mycobacterium tuberculosis]